MASIDPVWVFGGIALLAGALLGVLICRRFTPTTTEVDELRVKLEQSRSEMEQYRASVNGHFSKTSDLVKELTQDYAKVYQHLAEGAQTLSDAPEFSHVLEQHKGKVLISMNEEPGPQDSAAAQEEDFSAQDVEVEDVAPEFSGSGDSIAEDVTSEDVASKDLSDDVDEIEPIYANDDDKAKAAAGSEGKRDPPPTNDTQ
ncbi:MAG: DUF1043 family protein [Gammaproteobacteria bacterium]|nr:DUF1043 family protein [Gammaproteobacteria bacterium]